MTRHFACTCCKDEGHFHATSFFVRLSFTGGMSGGESQIYLDWPTASTYCKWAIYLTERYSTECRGPIAYCTVTKLLFMYSQKRNCAASSHIPNSCVCAVSDLYIPRIGPHIFLQQNRQIDREKYINRSQTHECGNLDCGHAIPFLGIFVSNFWYCVFAVWLHVRSPKQVSIISLLTYNLINLWLCRIRWAQMGEHASCKASSQPSQTSGQAGSQRSSMWEVKLSLHIPAKVAGLRTSFANLLIFADLKNFQICD